MPGKESSGVSLTNRRLRSGAEPIPMRSGDVPRTRGIRNVSPLPQVKPPPAPACERCVKMYDASCKTVDAYYALLSAVKAQYLQDTLRHVDENDVWIRALKTLGASEKEYLSRTVVVSEISAK